MSGGRFRPVNGKSGPRARSVQSMNPVPANVPPRQPVSRFRLGCLAGCGLILGAFVLAAVLLVAAWRFLGRIPRSYPGAPFPMEPVWASSPRANFSAGFDSPYLGHTGSWDGKGGGIFGTSKEGDLEAEKEMGLRWTFMPVHWRAIEPDGPADLQRGTPAAWLELDGFVLAARKRGLNILMQAPGHRRQRGRTSSLGGAAGEGQIGPAGHGFGGGVCRKIGGSLRSGRGFGRAGGVGELLRRARLGDRQ